MSLATELFRVIEAALDTLRLPASQITGQLAGSNLPPAGTGVPYAATAHTHAPEDITQAGASDGDVLTWDSGASEWAPAAPTGGGGSLTVEEVDGSPSVAATKLVFPNGTLGNVSGTVTYTPSGGVHHPRRVCRSRR